MDSPDITVQVLIQIRDELREFKEQTNARFDKMIAELAGTNSRIDQTNRKLDQTNRQLLVTEARLSTEISGLRDVVTELREVTSGRETGRDELRDRVERCERDIAELRRG